MVTALETRERVERKPITLQEFGEMMGVPIEVRPWWGSRRRRFVESLMKVALGDAGEVKESKVVGTKVHLEWQCPGGNSHTQPKFPEVQDGKIILWEGRCRYRFTWGGPKIHDHAQTIEVKAIAHKAMLIILRRSHVNYSQFLIGKDGSAPYAVPVNRRLSTVKEAFDWLMPNLVRKAIKQGLDVKRQGDWFFIPIDRQPSRRSNGDRVYGSHPELKTNLLYRGVPLVFNGGQTRHRGGIVVYQTIQGVNGAAPLVRGNVVAPDHPTLHLKKWHIGVRNRSTPWRSERLRERRYDD